MLQTTTEEDPDFHGLDALILNQLTDAEKARSVVYLDERLRPAGQSTLGVNAVEQGDPHVVAFIDGKPGANWMHACRYLLIDPATQKITSIDSDRPPIFGPLPPTWRVVWRSHGIEDWRLLPMARGPSQETQKEEKL